MAIAFDPAQVITDQDTRIYAQPGGAWFDNKVYLAGTGEMSYIDLTGLNTDINGETTFLKVQDPLNRKKWVNAAEATAEPEQISGTVVFHYARGGIPRNLIGRGCRWNFYVSSGVCEDLRELNSGWGDWVFTAAGGRIGNTDLGDLTKKDAKGDPLTASAAMRFRDAYFTGPVNFGLFGAAAATAEIMDITYGCKPDCGDCGPVSSGADQIYALMRGGAAAKPSVLYSLDGGVTVTALSILVAVNNEVPTAIEVMGKYLVVMSPTAQTSTNGGIYVSTLNALGVPGAFVKVGTGFVDAKAPIDMWVAGPKEAYICAQSGYVYKITDPLSGVTVVSDGSATAQDLNRIDGTGDVIVAGHNGPGIIKSLDRGITWTNVSVAAASAPGAVVVQNKNRISFVDSSLGTILYTSDGGTTWKSKSYATSGGTPKDMMFANEEVGFIVSGANLYATQDGGVSWTNIANRILNFPTIVTGNRIAIPYCGSTPETIFNNLLVCGLGAASSGRMVLGAGKIV
jgi:hypothetical protein